MSDNMKTETYSIYDIDYELQVPTTEAKYNEMAGANRKNACVEDAVDHTVFHVTNGRIRSKVSTLLEDELAFPRIKANKESGTKGESDATHFDRWLEATKPEDEGKSLVLKAAALCPFDPSVKTRAAAGPKTVSKQCIDAATALFSGPSADKVQRIAANLIKLNPSAKFVLTHDDPTKIEKLADGTYTILGLARLIHENEARIRREANLTKKYASLEEAV